MNSRIFVALLALLLGVGAACSPTTSQQELAPIEVDEATTDLGDDGDDNDNDNDDDDDDGAADAETPVAPADADGAEALWASFWAAATSENQAVELEALGSQLSEETSLVVSRWPESTSGAQASGQPIISSTNDGATIEDCISLASSEVVLAGQHYTGVAEVIDGALVLDVEGPFGSCAPKGRADEILRVYADYFPTAQQWWQPADPENPQIENLTTGKHQELLERVLVDLAGDGRYVVLVSDQADRNPEIVEYFPNEIVVRDCFDIQPDQGVFDVDDERIGELPTTGFNLDVITFQLEDERWKVAEIAAEVGVECTKKPSGDGVAIIG